MRSASHTDIGRVRGRNEDALLELPDTGVFAVADGLGGHPAGDVASSLAVQVLQRELTARPPTEATAARELAGSLRSAHRAVIDRAGQEPGFAGMATTAVLAWVSGERAWVAHVGDSRAYLLGDGALTQLTEDHSTGLYITQAIGISGDVQPDVAEVAVGGGARLLLCTDGLTNMVDDDRIARLVGSGSVDEACRSLVQAALAAGGIDNVTVVLVDAAG